MPLVSWSRPAASDRRWGLVFLPTIRSRSVFIVAIIFAVLAPCLANEVIRIAVKKTGAGPLFQIRRGARWGYMDRSGRTIITPQFDDEGDFFEGVATVQKDGVWGYIDETGRPVIPFRFESAGDFGEGLAPVQLHRRWGFIDRSGKLVVEPRFQAAAEFHEGLALVEVWNGIRCDDSDFTKDTAPLYAFRMHNTPPAVTIGCFSKEARFGFIDKLGRLVIAAKFRSASNFSEELAVVLGGESGTAYGYIDKTGRMAIAPAFDQASSFTEGLAAVEVSAQATDDEQPVPRWTFIRRDGALAFASRFVEAKSFSEGLAAVSPSAGRWGYIGRLGTLMIPAVFSEAGDFSEGLALVWPYDEEDGYYINSHGSVMLKPSLAPMWSFSDGLTVAGQIGQQMYIDVQGKVIARYEQEAAIR